MNIAAPNRILDLLLQLCKIPSVSQDAEQENRCADFILAFLRGLSQKAPDRLEIKELICEADPLHRKAVMALLRASRPTAKTVILTGHFDVVDTAVCGALKDVAFDLKAYTEALKTLSLPPSAAEDLASGDWLFGRGSMDMKAGIALFLASTEAWIDAPDLPVNVLLWLVPDEEADSAGMLGTLRAFDEWCKTESLQVVAALTGEPCFRTPQTEIQDAVRPYYLGSTGKMMPFFYVVTQPAHVGNYFEGLNAALLLSEIVVEAEANLRLFEGTDLDFLSPPTCLGMSIRRKQYSVTLPSRAVAYFNVLTATKSVDEIIRWAAMTAAKASVQARRKQEEGRLFAMSRGGDAPPTPQINVFQYRLLRKMAAAKLKDRFEKEREAFWESVPSETDAREAAIRECEWLIQKAEPPRPCVVVGLLPPLYPARVNRSRTPEEKALRSAIEEAVRRANELTAKEDTKMHEVFGGISDLSFLGFANLKKFAESAAPNMAGWGKVFELPTNLENDAEIPVANMGASGRDAHQATERLELHYSLEIAPRLLCETIQKLGA